jgi:steroid delta-isomerase-like uncharacterized protein
MTPVEIRHVIDQHLDAEARHDAAAAAATYAEHSYYQHVPLGLRLEGRDAVAMGYAASFAAMPDSELVEEGRTIEGTRFVHWGRFQATLTGSWLGLPPTGRRIDLPFAAVIELGDGRMVGETLYYDLATLCDQAGYTVDAVRAAAAAVRAAREAARAA